MICKNCNTEFDGEGYSVRDSEGALVFPFCRSECAKRYIKRHAPAEYDRIFNNRENHNAGFLGI